MKGDQFIAEVRNLTELASNEEAQKATRATLRERLAGNEPSNLASQLPPEVASYVDGSGSGEPLSVDEFYDRVAQKEGVSRDEAVRHARAVATVVQSAVTGGEIDDVRSQLGNEYEELFGQSGSSAIEVTLPDSGVDALAESAEVSILTIGEVTDEANIVFRRDAKLTAGSRVFR